jgi:hypothetical protein
MMIEKRDFTYFARESYDHSAGCMIKEYNIWDGVTLVSPEMIKDISSTSSEDDSSSNTSKELSSIEEKKKMKLSASPFLHGCSCGHTIEYRDHLYDYGKRLFGVTLRPKTSPLKLVFSV